jgi:hypothetical protein
MELIEVHNGHVLVESDENVDTFILLKGELKLVKEGTAGVK